MSILVLVLVAVGYFVLVGGGVWRHHSESSPGDDGGCSGADTPQPGWLEGGLAKVLAPFSPGLDVSRLRVGGARATLTDGILTRFDDEISISIPPSKEPARRLELILQAGPPVRVLYTPHSEDEDEDDACAQVRTDETPLRLAFTETRGVLKITRTVAPGSDEPSRIAFR